MLNLVIAAALVVVQGDDGRMYVSDIHPKTLPVVVQEMDKEAVAELHQVIAKGQEKNEPVNTEQNVTEKED